MLQNADDFLPFQDNNGFSLSYLSGTMPQDPLTAVWGSSSSDIFFCGPGGIGVVAVVANGIVLPKPQPLRMEKNFSCERGTGISFTTLKPQCSYFRTFSLF